VVTRSGTVKGVQDNVNYQISFVINDYPGYQFILLISNISGPRSSLDNHLEEKSAQSIILEQLSYRVTAREINGQSQWYSRLQR